MKLSAISPPAESGLPASALAQMAAAVLLLGVSWPITRVALLRGAGPAWFAFGRAGLATIVAFALLAAIGRLRRPAAPDLPALLAIGILQLAGFFAFAHAAVAHVPAGRTAVLANCTIVFTVPLSLLVLRERIPGRSWAAAALGAAGILVLIGPWSIDWTDRDALIGHLQLLGAALCWAIAMVVTRRRPPRMSMLELLPWTFLLATACLLPMAAPHATGQWDGGAALAMLAIGIVIAPAGTWCVMAAQSRLPLVVSSVGFLAGPALGVLLSTAFLGEALGPDMLIGAALILGAAAIAATKGRAGPPARPGPVP